MVFRTGEVSGFSQWRGRIDLTIGTLRYDCTYTVVAKPALLLVTLLHRVKVARPLFSQGSFPVRLMRVSDVFHSVAFWTLPFFSFIVALCSL